MVDINAILFPMCDMSNENLINSLQTDKKKLEQKDIVLEHSIEADDDEDDSFEEAADDSPNTEEDSSNEDEDFGSDDDMPSDSDDEFSDGDDEFSNTEDEDFGEGDDEDSDEDGQQDVDINFGSNTNPFVQVNQKLYLMDQMNQLYSLINTTIDEFNSQFAETAELQQLKELCDIVNDEKKTMIMQQNPENIINYKLYVNQFDKIVENLTNKIKEKNNVSI